MHLLRDKELFMSYLKEFKSHISHRDYPSFLKLWEEYCSGDELDAEEACEILRAVKQSDIADPVGRHVEKIIPLWQTLHESPFSHELIRLVVDIATTNHESLSTIAFDTLKKRYGDDPHFNDKIRLVGLRGKEKFQGAISNYELLSHMNKGNYVFHSGGWGVGEILDVSLVREQLVLEFDCIPGKKELSFSTAFKTLTPLQPDHFLALRFGSPDALEAQAKKDPVEIIRKLLKDLGPKTAQEIKMELCDLVIPEAEWSRWWQSTRSKLRKDTLISIPEDLREPFCLRGAALSHEDRLKNLLEKKLDVDALIQTIYSFLRDFPETLKSSEFKTGLTAKLSEVLSHHKDLSPAQAIQTRLLLQDVGNEKEAETASRLIQEAESIESLLNATDILSFKKRILSEVRKQRSGWKALFLDLLLTADQSSLRDYVLSELLAAKADEEVNAKLRDLYTHPARHPEAFLWYFQKLQTQKTLPFSDKQGKMRFFEGLLILLSGIENKPDAKEMVKKIHSLLSEERYALIRQTMQNASIEEVKECLLLVSKSHSLSDHDQKIFHSLAEVVYPSLAKQKKKYDTDSETENSVIWTTQEGFEKLQKRIQHIATVETVANAQEIEVARSHGDLRENAEFKAALEKRDRLQSELKLLSEQLKRARVITHQDISTKEVGIGTTVDCTNTKGEKVAYTLLGPWDANPDKNILSFQSKLAQTIKGKVVGDTFTMQSEELTITAIRSYL